MKPIRMLKASILFALACLAWLHSSQANAHAWLMECNIKFDNEFALTWNHTNARGTFAYNTGLNASDKTEPCNASHLACWTYRERCGSRGYVNVEEAPRGRYNHFHLMFEAPDLLAPCFASPTPDDFLGAGYGRKKGSGCVAADWIHEPRFAAGHEENHLIKVWIDDRVTHAPRIFDVASIRVRGSAPAQIWFQKNDDSWWYWPSLSPKRWDLSGYTNNIKAIYVRAAPGAGTSVSFDDVVVRN